VVTFGAGFVQISLTLGRFLDDARTVSIVATRTGVATGYLGGESSLRWSQHLCAEESVEECAEEGVTNGAVETIHADLQVEGQ